MKMRTKAIVLFTAALLLTTVIVLPRIIEAKRLKAVNANQSLSFSPLFTPSVPQDQKNDIKVVASYHNDTSIPLRDMKPQPLVPKGVHENENPKIPNKHRDAPDPVVQNSFSDLMSLMTVNMPVRFSISTVLGSRVLPATARLRTQMAKWVRRSTYR